MAALQVGDMINETYRAAGRVGPIVVVPVPKAYGDKRFAGNFLTAP